MQGEEAALGIEGESRPPLEVAGMHGALEFLGMVGDPGDGAAEPAGRGEQRDMFGEEEILHPEAAADIGAMQVEGGLLQAEDRGQLLADAVHAHAGEQQVEARAVPCRDGAARLDRRGMDAVVDEVELDDARGAGERRLGRGAVAALEAEGAVARRLGPYLRRAGGQRRAAVHHGGQRVVFHQDRLGGVARLRRRRRDHEGDRLADMLHRVTGQRMAGRDDERADGGTTAGQGSGPMPAAARSAPVSTSATPGMARAAAASTETIRACACGERSATPCSAPSGTRSAT